MADIAGSWQLARPRAPLPGVVDATGYRSSGVAPGVHRGLPSPYVTLVVSLDGPIVASFARDEVETGGAEGLLTVLGGLHTRPAYLQRPTAEAGIQLAVHPLACRALFGMPAAALSDGVRQVSDVWGADADRLRDRLFEAPTWESRFSVLREALGRKVSDPRSSPRDDVVEAWRRLAMRQGGCSVTELADHVQLGARQLTEVFRRELGLSPKRVARLMRYACVVRRLSSPRAQSLSETAAELGYADQAHLTREFVAFTGIPPTRWLVEELRSVQDEGEQAGSFWSHD